MDTAWLAATRKGPNFNAPLSAVLAWSSVLTAVWAPLLLQLGYGLLSHEVLAGVGISVIAGFVIAALTHVVPAAGVVVSSVALFQILDLYAMDVVNWPIATVDFVMISSACWILRQHIATLLAVGGIGFVTATALTSPTESYEPFTGPELSQRSQPALIHITFDEHAGPSGIPADVLRATEMASQVSDLTESGFRVFLDVNSASKSTQESLSKLANPGIEPGKYPLQMNAHGFEYRLTRNDYLDYLRSLGYRGHVLQTSFLDLCAGIPEGSIGCRTYPHNSASVLNGLSLSASDRLLILASLMDRSLSRTESSFLFTSLERGWLKEHLNSWRASKSRWRLQPLVADEMMTALEADLDSARRGDFYWAHLLTPHHPYVYASDCSLLQARDWHDIHVPSAVTSLSTRTALYERYLDQVRCLNSRIQRLLRIVDGNPELRDAILVIHGDHGSRIGPWEYSEIGPGYDHAEYQIDFRRVLFAVRAPGLTPGTDTETHRLDAVFWTTIGQSLTNGQARR